MSPASHACPPWFVELLRCPDCRGRLCGGWQAGEFACEGCRRVLPVVNGQLSALVGEAVVRDLVCRPRQRTTHRPTFAEPPDGRYNGPPSERVVPRHLSILAERGPEALRVLDWGCGPAHYRTGVEKLGHRYMGVDCEGPAADVRADVHSLPLASESLDHVITGAVLEHVANPFLAVGEVARVLKPGGVFSGSAAFLEPHHFGSRFHLTADAVVAVLGDAGLSVRNVWPQEDWLVFDSLASMDGPVSWVSRRLLRLVGSIERALRRRYLHPRERAGRRWLQPKGRAAYAEELLAIAGQVDFVATKGIA